MILTIPKCALAIPFLLFNLPSTQDPDSARVKVLIKQLASDDVGVRDQATAELLRMGKRVLPLLEAYEKTIDTEIRARLAEVRKRLVLPGLEDLFEAAREAVHADSKLETWHPKLRSLVQAQFDHLKKHLPSKEAGVLDKVLRRAFALTGIARSKKTVGTYRNSIMLAKEPSAGAAVECLVIAPACTDVDGYKRCVVISLGDVKGSDDTFGARDSIILAVGDVTGEFRGSIVRTLKRVRGIEGIDTCVVVAGGGVEADASSNNVFVNTPSMKLLRSENDREIKD